MELEHYKKKLAELIEWNKSIQVDKRNEATTRLHLIDHVLFDCLGWPKENCIAEESEDKKYTDYTFLSPSRVFILEAKREGIYFDIPAGLERRVYKIKSLFEKGTSIRNAIEQAIGYCQQRGVAIGGVSNGQQYILFVASRKDGNSPLDGKAIVYNSLEDIDSNFIEFWNFLSKEGIIQKNIEKKLLSAITPVLPAKLKSKIDGYPGVKNRNEIQAELQILSDLLLEELITSDEIEEDFLKSTYCVSGALSQYALISKNILQSRYSTLSNSKKETPQVEPIYTKKGISPSFSISEFTKRPILLLGDVGSGKTMFIKNFIKVEAKEIIENTISLYIDLGTKAALTFDLREFFLNEISNLLEKNYDIDIYERNFIRGVYNLELVKFEKGIYGELKEIELTAYKKEEISFLKNLTNEKDKHIKRCLHHICKGRKKQVVIFMDNVDQRKESIQEDAFFIANDIAQNWDASVFLTLRPSTYYKSKREGALTGYHPKAFTVAPPRVDEVILKRLKFAQSIAKGDKSFSSIDNNTIIRLSTLLQYLEILEYSFTKSRDLIEFIDNISYGNIRQALEFITTFIGSGHVDTKKILDKDEAHLIQKDGKRYLIPLHEFLRAIIYGDNIFYNPTTTCISNIFEVNENDPKEHFLGCIITEFLNKESSNSKFGFVNIDEVLEYCQKLKFSQSQILDCILFLLSKKLIDSELDEIPKSSSEISKSVRITSLGAYHFHYLINRFVYIDAVIDDTPILIDSFKEKIKISESLGERLERALVFKEYLDKAWEDIENKNCSFNWAEYSKDLIESIKSIQIKQQ